MAVGFIVEYHNLLPSLQQLFNNVASYEAQPARHQYLFCPRFDGAHHVTICALRLCLEGLLSLPDFLGSLFGRFIRVLTLVLRKKTSELAQKTGSGLYLDAFNNSIYHGTYACQSSFQTRRTQDETHG
jgi:hypothetical protein